ncbi:metalloregulator ArsR/SmtB family transcription factor [Flavobacterium sp. MFBS3-15]|uniref:ArsR/SmtB family transcription factor n=1 Tax=Flavobacterium sp. MFBS3-15 TaxID=2989816 RepID=UPI002236580A|nr:metalloregulator ArsR/SmtB family transcription factor [Flavobacterium sp. MFBS3-15]MCW4470151.1 metalloregulator ArsR/SmtB family transcription factor [Flavobacterium sp. MFBS3-15]
METRRRDVFQAIADPTRREIINMLAKKQMTVNAVAEHFSMTRPAVSKHLRILAECGLVTMRQEGRERFCRAHFDKLKEVSEWVARYKSFWDEKLDALGDFLDTSDA